jgi:hypothetical protein
VPDHSTFSKNRHGRFLDCDLLRQLFETTVRRCMAEGLVGADGFAADASLIKAIDLDHAVIVDVEASRAIRQAEVGAVRTMIDRVQDQFGLYPPKTSGN